MEVLIVVIAVLTVALAGVAVAEGVFRLLEPALPTHPLWHDTLPALRVQQMLELRRRHGAVDLVICGSSVVHSGLDPAVVAERAGLERGYNAALHRGFYDMVVPWLIAAVIPILRPKIVVLGAAIYDLNDNGPLLKEEPALYRAALLGRPGRLGALARRLERVSALFRHHRALRSPALLAKAVRHRRAGTIVPQKDKRDSRSSLGPNGEWIGFHGRSYLTTEAMHHHITQGVLGDFDLGGEQLAIVERNLRELQRHVPTVVLTTIPLSEHLAPNLPNGQADIDAANDALRALAARVGVPLLEPDPDVTVDEHFADIAHLNDRGMARFSRALGDQLGALLRSQASTPIPTAR